MTDEDKKFLDNFKEERIERVRKAIESAKEKAHKLPQSKSYISTDDWEVYTTECPVCGNDAILEGYTEIVAEQDDIDSWSQGLDFFADTFKCEECGLALDESEELRLAGIDTHYDRSDEMDKWSYEEWEGY